MRREFKLTLVAVALLGLFSCSIEHEVNPPLPQEEDAISFSKVTTRAEYSDIVRDGFSVWTVHFNTAQPNGYLLMDKQKVTYDDDRAEWVYSPVKYWLHNTIFNFVAAYPESAGFETKVYEENGNMLNYVALNDFDTSDQSKVVDLLGATAIVDTSVEDYTKTVPLTFNHLLCRINVCVMQDGDQNREDNFIIDKISLSGVKTKGSYNFFPVRDEVVGLWSLNNQSTEFVREFKDNANIGLDGKRYLSDDALMLIPQSIGSEAMKLTINFRFGAQGTEDISLYESKTLDAYLPMSEDLWQSGKSITYNVKVSTYNPIIFLTPSVSSWGNLQSGGTIIIK